MSTEDTTLSTDSFAEMLSGGADNEQTEQSDSQSADDAQENSEGTDQQDGSTEGDDAQDGGDDNGEAGEEGQDEQPAKDSTEAFLELEINGEKVALTKDEAKNGYLRQQDYTQKAQRLAQERQQWDAHVAQQAAEVKQYAKEIGQLHSIDAALEHYERIDWEQLRAEDPVSFGAHLAEFNDMRLRRGQMETAITQKLQSLTAQQQQAQAQARAQQTAEAQAHMAALVPGFGKEHVAEMKAIGQKAGFTDAELAGVTDKRMLEVLWKASQFDKQQNTKQQAIKKVSALPTKAAKAAPAAKPAAQLHIEKQTRRLQQTGSVKDLAAALAMTS
ncbi:MAG TPA: hypothetical protein DDZ22_06930 [Massilia sp.]|nr:hypothetical protein [Massilia sp.]